MACDEDITPSDKTITPLLKMLVPTGRAQARHFNLRVSSFLMSCFYGFENRLLPNELIIVRNRGDDKDDVGERLGGVGSSKDGQSSWRTNPSRVRIHLEVQELSVLKKDAQATYRLGFGHSVYGWK